MIKLSASNSKNHKADDYCKYQEEKEKEEQAANREPTAYWPLSVQVSELLWHNFVLVLCRLVHVELLLILLLYYSLLVLNECRSLSLFLPALPPLIMLLYFLFVKCDLFLAYVFTACIRQIVWWFYALYTAMVLI